MNRFMKKSIVFLLSLGIVLSSMSASLVSDVYAKGGGTKVTSYTITYDVNGGTMVGSNTQTYTANDNLQLRTATRTGYTFGGWKVTSNTTGTWTKGNIYSGTLGLNKKGNVALQAVWTEVTTNYTITYDAGSGTVTPSSQTYSKDAASITLATPKWEGHSFNGWKPAETVGSWNKDTVYSGTLGSGYYGHVTVDAVWDTYYVTYDYNDGTSTKSIAYTTGTQLTIDIPTRSGYTFDGWKVTATTDNTSWPLDSIITVADQGTDKKGNVTLKAQWTEKSANVSTNKSASLNETDKTVQITLDETKTEGPTGTPKMLFLGTMCNAHTLTFETIVQSIVATAQFGDVHYELFQNNGILTRLNNVSGDIPMGSGDTYVRNQIASVENMLAEGVHSSLYEFANIIKNATFGTASSGQTHYDYIVMEFDGMRMGHFNDSSLSSSAKSANTAALNDAADVLKTYYAADKVAWLIPSDKHTEPNNLVAYDYTNNKVKWTDNATKISGTDTFIYNDIMGDYDCDAAGVYRSNTRLTIKLMAPEDLDSSHNLSNKQLIITAKEGDETTAQKHINGEAFPTLKSRLDGVASGEDIWVYYDDPDEVFNFLQNRLSVCNLKIEDIVASGLTITSVEGQYQEINADGTPSGNWVTIDSEATDKFSYTSSEYKEGDTVKGTKVVGEFSLNSIYGGDYGILSSNMVRLVINCSIDNYETFFTLEDNTKAETNYGQAYITLQNGVMQVVNDEDPAEVTKTVKATLHYHANDSTGSTASGVPQDQTLTKAAASVSSDIPTRPGYVFAGWNTQADGKGTSYAAGASYKEADIMPSDGDLYAMWTSGLSIEKSASLAKVGSGNNLVYTIKVKNETEAEVTGLTVTDAINTSYLTYVEPETTDPNVEYKDGTVTFKNVSVPAASATTKKAGETTLQFTVKASLGTATTAQTVGNVAKLSDSDKSEIASSDNLDVQIVPVYKVTYAYTGITPTGATLPTPNPVTGILSGTQFDATTPSVISGWTFDGWYLVTTCTGDKYINGTAITEDKNLYGKWAYGIDITKSVDSGKTDKSTATAQGYATYTLKVTNNTDAKVTGLTVTDDLSSLATYLEYDATETGKITTAVPTASGSKLTWSDVSVNANGYTELKFVVKTKDVTAEATVNNVATVKDSAGKETTSEDTDAPLTIKPREFKITYHFVDDIKPKDTTLPAQVTKTYGTKYNAESMTTVSGWKFDGWYQTYDEKTGVLSDQYIDGTEIKGDVNLYGKWTYQLGITKSVSVSAVTAGGYATYTLTINNTGDAVTGLTVTDDLSGYTDSMTYDATKTAALENVILPTSTTGNVLTWSDVSIGKETSKVFQFVVKTNGKLELTPVTIKNSATLTDGKEALTTDPEEAPITINPKKFTVTYNYNNKPVTSAEPPAADTDQSYGTQYNTKLAGTYAGWTFSGWYTDKDCKNAYIDGTKLTDDMQLYGNWTYGLDITKSVNGSNAATVTSGDYVTYTLTVSNTSASKVEGLTVTDDLSNYSDYIAYDAAKTGEKATVLPTVNGNKLTWSNVSVDGNGTTQLVFVVKTKDVELENKTVKNVAVLKDTYDKETTSDETDTELTIKPKQLTVTYHFKNKPVESAAEPEAETKPYGTEYNTKSAGSYAGWTFSGWCTDEACTEAYVEGTKLTADDDLYGKWTYGLDITKYIADSDKATVTSGDYVTYTLKITNNTGAEVTGLTVTDDLSSFGSYLEYSADKTAEITGAVRPSSVEGSVVTWSNISVPARGIVSAGETVLKFVVKTKDVELTSKTVKNIATLKDTYNKETTTEDTDTELTINPKQLTVTYNFKNKPVSTATPPTDSAQPYGTQYNTKSAGTYAGWTFSGWCTDEACKNAYIEGTKLIDDIQLYGKWTCGLSVSKTADIVEATASGKKEVNAGETFTYSITVSNTTDSAVNNLIVTDVLDENLELVEGEGKNVGASYDKLTRTVTWENVSVAAKSGETAGTKVLTLTVKAKASLTDDVAVSNKAKLSDKMGDLDESSTETVTIRKKATLSYDAMGGENEPDDAEMTYAEKTIVSEQEPAKDGAKFLGWSTDSLAKTVDYESGDEFKAENVTPEDTTLYAVWQIRVKFSLKGSLPPGVNVPDDVELISGEEFSPDKVPTVSGYKFSGWYTDPEFTEPYEAGTELDEDTILYGKWEKLPVADTGDANDVGLYSGLALLASLGSALVAIGRRKRYN